MSASYNLLSQGEACSCQSNSCTCQGSDTEERFGHGQDNTPHINPSLPTSNAKRSGRKSLHHQGNSYEFFGDRSNSSCNDCTALVDHSLANVKLTGPLSIIENPVLSIDSSQSKRKTAKGLGLGRSLDSSCQDNVQVTPGSFGAERLVNHAGGRPHNDNLSSFFHPHSSNESNQGQGELIRQPAHNAWQRQSLRNSRGSYEKAIVEKCNTSARPTSFHGEHSSVLESLLAGQSNEDKRKVLRTSSLSSSNPLTTNGDRIDWKRNKSVDINTSTSTNLLHEKNLSSDLCSAGEPNIQSNLLANFDCSTEYVFKSQVPNNRPTTTSNNESSHCRTGQTSAIKVNPVSGNKRLTQPSNLGSVSTPCIADVNGQTSFKVSSTNVNHSDKFTRSSSSRSFKSSNSIKRVSKAAVEAQGRSGLTRSKSLSAATDSWQPDKRKGSDDLRCLEAGADDGGQEETSWGISGFFSRSLFPWKSKGGPGDGCQHNPSSDEPFTPREATSRPLTPREPTTRPLIPREPTSRPIVSCAATSRPLLQKDTSHVLVTGGCAPASCPGPTPTSSSAPLSRGNDAPPNNVSCSPPPSWSAPTSWPSPSSPSRPPSTSSSEFSASSALMKQQQQQVARGSCCNGGPTSQALSLTGSAPPAVTGSSSSPRTVEPPAATPPSTPRSVDPSGSAPPSTTSRWWFFGKGPQKKKNDKPPPLAAGSVGLIMEARPEHLPAKSAQERLLHQQQHQQLLEQHRRRQQQVQQEQQRALETRLRLEAETAEAVAVWTEDIIPQWSSKRDTRRCRDLWWRGLPSCVRGRVWQLALGNALNVSPHLYHLLASERREEDESASATDHSSKPVPGPSFSSPPTSLPPTSFPTTSLPLTSLPPTSFPPTSFPPTSFPPTSFPPTSFPPTSFPPTSLPPTSLPSTNGVLTYPPPSNFSPAPFSNPPPELGGPPPRPQQRYNCYYDSSSPAFRPSFGRGGGGGTGPPPIQTDHHEKAGWERCSSCPTPRDPQPLAGCCGGDGGAAPHCGTTATTAVNGTTNNFTVVLTHNSSTDSTTSTATNLYDFSTSSSAPNHDHTAPPPHPPAQYGSPTFSGQLDPSDSQLRDCASQDTEDSGISNSSSCFGSDSSSSGRLYVNSGGVEGGRGGSSPWTSWQEVAESADCITLDVSRTFPHLCIFQEGGPYHAPLRTLLHCYVRCRPDQGYVQGMSFLAATLLLNMPETEAFVTFANLLNRPLLQAFYSLNHKKMAAYYRTFSALLRVVLPSMWSHLRRLEVTPDLYLLDWLMSLYTRCLPLDVASRLWDLYARDGDEFLFRAAFGILKAHERELVSLECTTTAAQFLTRLPPDTGQERLFDAIRRVAMPTGRKGYAATLQKHEDEARATSCV